eukprot:01898.XXX_11115_11279_1 [CDS] Oithona nana genome sequencing.
MIVAVNIRQNYILEFQLEPEGHQYVFQDLGCLGAIGCQTTQLLYTIGKISNEDQ